MLISDGRKDEGGDCVRKKSSYHVGRVQCLDDTC
uniref:Uncharacterized protein n=1 Tax=Anguilla anguilla TaxID=7936 RepID=A0A0E9XG36_ANGAN